MITYTITGDNVSVGDDVRTHIDSHYKKFEKFADQKINHEMFITFSKSTVHHREDSFRVEIKFKINAENYFVSVNNIDLISAVDDAKDALTKEITKKQDRGRTLFHRGARKLKSIAQSFGGSKNK